MSIQASSQRKNKNEPQKFSDEEWRRRIALLKLAFQKPVFTHDDLVNPLDDRESIYDENVNLQQAFNRDRYWLLETLDIHIEPLGGPGSRNHYQLKKIGSRFSDVFIPAGLTTLLALVQLPELAPNFPPKLLEQLLDDIRRRLGVDGGRLDEALSGAEQLAAWRDPGQVDTGIIEQVRSSIQSRRVIVFDYAPARVDDDVARRHVVEPYRLYTRDGHLYLSGYARQTDGPYGVQPGRHYDFRVGRILAESLQALDDHYLAERPRPRYPVHYLLSPKLSKDGGSVSFDESSRVVRPDGWLEIRAFTEQPFDAMRKLLTYGAQCHVLGGDEVRRYYQRELEQMFKLYGGSAPSFMPDQA